MRLSEHIRKQLIELLDDHRIVVWYDGERAFGVFAETFIAANCRVVSATDSALLARRAAESVYRKMEESQNPSEAQAIMLIYVPRSRSNQDLRTQDPFEVFAVSGAVFGEAESEQLQSLARTAMPELMEQIDGLFMSGHPSFALLDSLNAISLYPLLQEGIGTQSGVDACIVLMSSEHAQARLERTHGARDELLQLLQSEIGFRLTGKARSSKSLRGLLSQFILLSELAFDLPVPLPDSLLNIQRADLTKRERIFTICERLRNSDDTRDVYITLANGIENDLKLRDHFHGITQLGVRDTFAFEERQYLTALDEAVRSDRLPDAREILEGRSKSVWRHQPERAQIWQVAERCVTLLESAVNLTSGPMNLSALTEAYTRVDGWSDLDRQQRLMEQSFADCADCEEIQAVVEFTRRRYRECIDSMQDRFLKQTKLEGWPPERLLRQTQIFDRFVAPILETRGKVAYILADSLRFEMGRALASELEILGDVNLQPAAAALPTVTPNGMAALMPGADGALALYTSGDILIPYIGDRPLKDSDARMAYLNEKFGDRFAHLSLGDWLDFTEKKRASFGGRIGLLVIRVPDIDELGEHVSLRQARKHMSDLLGELKTTAVQLARLGFSKIVIAADHGHVLLPEIPPGDTVTTPEGQWGLNKRRSKLGSQLKERVGSITFKPSQLSILTDATDFCVPVGFSVYTSDANYFHEGLSLEECIIPVIELQPKGRPDASAKQQQIEIRYGRERFTSQVIGLKVYYSSLLGDTLRIRLDAFDSSNLKGPAVGEAADCAARDENTHEVTLQPNTETDVPVLVVPDFVGPAIEVRALDPNSGIVWAKLKLKNGIMD